WRVRRRQCAPWAASFKPGPESEHHAVRYRTGQAAPRRETASHRAPAAGTPLASLMHESARGREPSSAHVSRSGDMTGRLGVENLRHATRSLAQSPGFTASAVL